jgi:hypothetical protein
MNEIPRRSEEDLEKKSKKVREQRDQVKKEILHLQHHPHLFLRRSSFDADLSPSELFFWF